MDLEVCQLGLVSYAEALAVQEQLLVMRQQNRIGDLLLLLEHNPVITLGRKAKTEHILMPQEWLQKQQIEVYRTNRGGDVTYHGPGQIVGYMFIDLHHHGRSLRSFVHKLEQVFINLLERYYQINAFRDPDHTGVWVSQGKITAIGLAVKRWVTMHGFAFNVNTNLEHFRWIVPCGIADKEVTSLAVLTGREIDLQGVYQQVLHSFCEFFHYNPVILSQAQLQSYLGSMSNEKAQT